MFKHTTNLVLGVLVVLVPFSGFPRSWRTFLLVIFGLIIALFSYLARREKSRAALNSQPQAPKPQKSPEPFMRPQPVEEVVRPRLPRYEEMYAERAAESAPASQAKPLFYATAVEDENIIEQQRPVMIPMTVIDSVVVDIEEVEEPAAIYSVAETPRPVAHRKRKTASSAPVAPAKVKTEKAAPKRKSRAKVPHTHEE